MPRKWSHPGRQHSSQWLQVVLACLDELHEQPRRTAMPGLSFFVQNIEQGVHQLQLSVGHIALLDAAEMTSSSIRNSTTAISGKGVPLLDELHESHFRCQVSYDDSTDWQTVVHWTFCVEGSRLGPKTFRDFGNPAWMAVACLYVFWTRSGVYPTPWRGLPDNVLVTFTWPEVPPLQIPQRRFFEFLPAR